MNLLTDKIRPMYFRYLIAATGSAFVYSVFGIVDAAMIGNYHGPLGNAALAVFSPIWAVAYCLGLLLGVGGGVLFGNARGKGDEKSAQAYFSVTVLFGAILSVLTVLIIGFFRIPLLRLFGGDDTLIPLCTDYLSWILFALPCCIFVNIWSSFLRTDGAPVLPAVAVIAGGCLNILGDYLLIYRLDLGIRGAGIATAAGLVLSNLILLLHFLRKKNTLRLVKARLGLLREIVKNGFPTAVNDLALGILAILFNRQIMIWLGTEALAVYGIATLIATIVQCLAYGIGQAAQPILSENHGAAQAGRVKECLRCGIETSFVLGAAAAVLVFLLPEPLVRLFTDPTAELLAIAPGILRVYGLSFLFLPFNIFATYYFQAIMKERIALAGSAARGVVLSGALVLLLPAVFGPGSIFWAMPVSEMTVCGFLLLFVRRQQQGSVTGEEDKR
ncbi:MAG: MATE family efflux transporter [Lachnospiraceae bacterium]|nr:MATE family efflux transporter [Lachnospiraceae bacterium]